jgi:hypothetical protein
MTIPLDVAKWDCFPDESLKFEQSSQNRTTKYALNSHGAGPCLIPTGILICLMLKRTVSRDGFGFW